MAFPRCFFSLSLQFPSLFYFLTQSSPAFLLYIPIANVVLVTRGLISFVECVFALSCAPCMYEFQGYRGNLFSSLDALPSPQSINSDSNDGLQRSNGLEKKMKKRDNGYPKEKTKNCEVVTPKITPKSLISLYFRVFLRIFDGVRIPLSLQG